MNKMSSKHLHALFGSISLFFWEGFKLCWFCNSGVSFHNTDDSHMTTRCGRDFESNLLHMKHLICKCFVNHANGILPLVILGRSEVGKEEKQAQDEL